MTFNIQKTNSIKNLFFLFFIFSHFIVQSQDAFRYQAVARDTSGAPIANQLIGLQISIILETEYSAPSYIETHQVESNNYGVFNLDIGNGIPIEGDFSTLDWSQKGFIKIEIDITGGANYDLVSLSELLSVPKALYAESAKRIEGGFGLNVKDFGAKGDNLTDDTDAFETALITAEVNGAKLFVPQGIYRITRTLEIGDGVSLIGEGSGSTPLETPHNGSLLHFEGNGFAIKINGHSSRLKDLVIRDKSNEQAAGGILIEADGRLIESVYVFEVLVSGFTNGTGLELSAKNSGGIAYGSFNNVRIRHGKIGIRIDPSNNSFVNSNTWDHCQVSGGGFDYGMVIEGGNNNIMNGVVIEPLSSNIGHLVVKKGELIGSEMRIEGANQDPKIPLILFYKKTQNSTITGTYAGGLTLDKGNNFINMKSGKAIHYKNSSYNRFKNATFFSPDNNTITDWKVKGNNLTISVENPELSPTHNVIKLTVPAGITATLEPDNLSRPKIKDLPLYDQVNFGFHIKSTEPDIIFASTNAPIGWTNSSPYSGSDEWEFVGMNAEVNKVNQARFALIITNTTANEIDVYITTPTVSFGNQLPTLDEAPLFESGGKLNGLLIHALAEVTVPSDGYLTIPLTANYFEVTNVANIQRLNHLTADRFPKGSTITLLFNNSGINVTNSGYINLKAGYTSVTNGSLTLISNGNGTWREVNRNN